MGVFDNAVVQMKQMLSQLFCICFFLILSVGERILVTFLSNFCQTKTTCLHAILACMKRNLYSENHVSSHSVFVILNNL